MYVLTNTMILGIRKCNMPRMATRGMHKQVVAIILRLHYLKTTVEKNKAFKSRSLSCITCINPWGPGYACTDVITPGCWGCPMHMGATIFASQSRKIIAEQRSWSRYKKRLICLYLQNFPRISHIWYERADRGAVVLEAFVPIARSYRPCPALISLLIQRVHKLY